MATLLFVDDDNEVLEINQQFFTKEGYKVVTLSNPLECQATVKATAPDVIILDVMMPGLDGYTLCRELRKATNTPIIFLTGKTSEDDKINGLITGADDYMIKPYSLKELKARIDVILRRVSMMNKEKAVSNQMTFGNLTIDMIGHKALFKGEDLQLTNREYDVLVYLAKNPGKEVTFEELGTTLFGFYTEQDRRSVMVNVSRLRKKMEIDFELENMIETVWSKGYKFVGK